MFSIITTNLHRLTENILNNRKGKKLFKTAKNEVIIQNLLKW